MWKNVVFLVFLGVVFGQDCEGPNCHCPRWGPWENVTCWWPSKSYDSLPKSCTKLPFPPKVPAVIRHLFESEIRDVYNMIATEYTLRGKPGLCGHCSLSFKCRLRQNKSEGEGLDEEVDAGRRHFCIPKEVRPIRANCSDNSPCHVKKVFGGCPVPFFLKRGGHRRARHHMENGDLSKAIDELINMPMDESDFLGQEKRQEEPLNNDNEPTPVGHSHRVWLNRRWRPWSRNRYQVGRPGMYPSDRETLSSPSRNAMPMRKPDHRHHRPSPRQIIIWWLLHGTKCISSGNSCLCCCHHFVPNAQNKTCDDIFKLHPHLEKLAEKDENADYGDQMPMMSMAHEMKHSMMKDYMMEKMDKHSDNDF